MRVVCEPSDTCCCRWGVESLPSLGTDHPVGSLALAHAGTLTLACPGPLCDRPVLCAVQHQQCSPGSRLRCERSAGTLGVWGP